MRFLSDLIGTLAAYFRIRNVRLKDNGGALDIRDKDDTAFTGARTSIISVLLPAGTNSVSLSLPSEPVAPLDFKLPVADGTSGQVLTSDGAEGLYFTSVATAENTVKVYQSVVGHASVSPIAMFVPPANSTIRKIVLDVEEVFDGAAPQLSVGVTGDTARYMSVTANELDKIGIFEVMPLYEEDGTPEQIIVTLNADSSTTGSARVNVEYKLPDPQI